MRQNGEILRKYIAHTQDTKLNASASFRAAAWAARLKSCTHGPSRPPACKTMLELRATSLSSGALLRNAPNAPPKTASSSRVLRALRAWTERSESTRDLRIVALSSRTDDESARRCDPSQAPGTAASAMLIAVFGKRASLSKLERGTRRTASAPAWASMGSAHCPLRHCASG